MTERARDCSGIFLGGFYPPKNIRAESPVRPPVAGGCAQNPQTQKRSARVLAVGALLR
jgi:hypothetical protein